MFWVQVGHQVLLRVKTSCKNIQAGPGNQSIWMSPGSLVSNQPRIDCLVDQIFLYYVSFCAIFLQLSNFTTYKFI